MYPDIEGTYLRDIESPELVKPTLNIPSVASASGRGSANWWNLVDPVTPEYLDPSYFGPKPEEEEMKMNHPNNIIDDQVIKSEKPNQEENQPKNEIIENNISNNNK